MQQSTSMGIVTSVVQVVKWLDAPEEHDYPAASAYLQLIATDTLITEIVARLKTAETIHQKAKDLLRASRLPLLGPDNKHVAADLHKIAHGRPLSPILLVRGDLTIGLPLVIADGYHRVCASYHTDENTDIPCRLVPAPIGTSAATMSTRSPSSVSQAS